MHELEVEEGPNRGARYALSPGQATIGRDVSCEVSVIDERASRRHVRLELAQDGSVTVEDLESRNGTLLNGLPLLPGARAPLRAGDRIAIGSTVLVLAAGTGLDAASAPTVARTAVGTAGTTGRSVELRAPRDSARVLELVARLGALLSEGDRLGSALSAALEVAGGARAAILVLEGT